ncbi:hypothetical protein QTP88_008637 [Uroleucon formosanum]
MSLIIKRSSELKSIAKEAKLKGYSTLKKIDLISRIRNGRTICDLNISELKSIAKEAKLKGYSTLKKIDLVSRIRNIRDLNISDIINNRNQVSFRNFHGEIFRTDNTSLNNNPFQKLEKSFFTGENYFNSSLEKTPEVYELIDVIQLNKKVQKKFKIHEADYKICFKEALIKDLKLSNTKYKIDYIHKALDSMLKLVKKNSNYEKGDLINIIVMNPSLKNTISTGMKSDNFLNNLKSIISNILTSDETIDITETTFQVQLVKIPRGSNQTKIINLSENIKTKNSIIQINNDDNLCCPRAIVVALSTQTNKILGHELDSNKIKQLKIGRKIQKDLALELCNMLTEYNEEGFTLNDIKNVELALDIQINVICAENLNTLIYKGDDKETKIYLYKNGNHFDVIKSAKGFYGSSYYCEKCDKPYQNKNKHKCLKNKNKDKNVCKLCTDFGKRFEHLSSTKNRIYCEKCNRYCFNQECLDNHNYICNYVYKCIDCNRIVLRDTDHKYCGYSKCRNCKEYVKINEHQCYMQSRITKGGKCLVGCTKCGGTNKPYQCTFTEKYLFFDYEAQQETGTHIANKIIAHDFFGNKIMFDTNEEFCKHVISEEYKGYTFIAHYAKGYDSQFILKYLVDNTLKPFTIYNGTKLMLLEIKYLSIRIIDSSNFIQGPLSSFPKTFGLNELKKGYFPHFFNTVENQNYIGILPDKKYYGFETMKTENKIEFEKWYNEKINENYIFNFKEELEAYCDSDVDILRRGCLELRKQFLDIANIDPFCYTTIAGVCMAIYKSKYLISDTIAVLDKEKNENYSKQSITWLQHFNNKNISHALNGGEKIIAGAKVDGFDNKSKTVYQYNGCFWHGCTKCYKDRETINNINHETMEDLYPKTIDRSTIKNAADIADPINPRDAFFGGRTNATKLRVKNTKMRYIDVCSLYPTVNYYDHYPVGHPEKIFKPKVYDKNWFGLIKCKILPPRNLNLYHPVLPVKIKMEKSEKLLFPLCYKCAVDQKPSCNHSKNERQFTGTWTTDEVNKTLEKGYIITKIYEVWHFEEKSTGLFKDYVDNFMKIKLESSKHNNSSDKEYIKSIFDKMGILLDKYKICDNPGRRAVAKLFK